MLKIKISENGPILIEFNKAILYRNDKQEELQQKRIALCRCGQSSKIPFCDGMHKSCGFKADAAEIELQ